MRGELRQPARRWEWPTMAPCACAWTTAASNASMPAKSACAQAADRMSALAVRSRQHPAQVRAAVARRSRGRGDRLAASRGRHRRRACRCVAAADRRGLCGQRGQRGPARRPAAGAGRALRGASRWRARRPAFGRCAHRLCAAAQARRRPVPGAAGRACALSRGRAALRRGHCADHRPDRRATAATSAAASHHRRR